MTRSLRLSSLLVCLGLLAVTATATAQDRSSSRVRFETTMGDFVIQLETERAPLTTERFVKYVREGYYNGTVFHRVINNFVAQAGGYTSDYLPLPDRESVVNESGNGLSNRRGTVGLARTGDPHSGGAQFYVNLVDNPALDPQPSRWGYAVFGRVVDGMDVLDRIGHVATGARGELRQDAPLEPIVIKKAELLP
ncbi:MAG TPA: peptidylprolyl isomerase [Steroidobacteraceae bacterium]|nr:peptidylprolyl isomerase [Steroidobacteraceae bacterium]